MFYHIEYTLCVLRTKCAMKGRTVGFKHWPCNATDRDRPMVLYVLRNNLLSASRFDFDNLT